MRTRAQKTKLRNGYLRSRLKKHRLVILICFLAITLAGSLIYYFWISTNSAVARTEQQVKQMQQEGDKAIAKALEAKRLATEEEAKKAVAAKAAAEQSISANAGVEPSVINSTDCRFTSSHSNPGSILVLVNKKNCIQPVSFVPSRLVTIYNATLVPEAAEAFSAMYEAAQVAGQPFSVTSSYRSYELQASTYAYWVSVSGSQGADTYSARPGYSEHQTGLAVDVAAPGCVLNCFGGTSQYTWFQNNAASYGFNNVIMPVKRP